MANKLYQMTPKEIVQELDKYIIGQDEAKKSVAIALRNRYRRSLLSEKMREEITPKNILMMGPTGCGKTEIAFAVAPDFFDVIFFSHFYCHHVDDNIAVIHEDPARAASSFHTLWEHAFRFQQLLYIVNKCRHLPFASSRCHDKIVCKGRFQCNVDHLYIDRFSLIQKLCDFHRHFF